MNENQNQIDMNNNVNNVNPSIQPIEEVKVEVVDTNIENMNQKVENNDTNTIVENQSNSKTSTVLLVILFIFLFAFVMGMPYIREAVNNIKDGNLSQIEREAIAEEKRQQEEEKNKNMQHSK